MTNQDENREVTEEEIKRFKQLQNLKKMLNLAQISRERESDLTQMALELLMAGNNKDQIAQILAIREALNLQEERALRTILSAF